MHVGFRDAWLRLTRYYTLDTVAESSSHALPHKSLVSIIVTESMSFRLDRNDLSCELTETGCAASVNSNPVRLHRSCTITSWRRSLLQFALVGRHLPQPS